MSVYTRNLPDMWDNFHREKVDRSIDEKTYKKIVLGFFVFITSKVLDGYDVYLPANLGHIGIRGIQITPQVDKDGVIAGLPVDWKETRRLWRFDPVARAKKKTVYTFNEHTNGIVYAIHWHRQNVEVPNKTLYSFRVSRDIKSRLAKAINEGAEYADRVVSHKKREYAKQITREATEIKPIPEEDHW